MFQSLISILKICKIKIHFTLKCSLNLKIYVKMIDKYNLQSFYISIQVLFIQNVLSLHISYLLKTLECFIKRSIRMRILGNNLKLVTLESRSLTLNLWTVGSPMGELLHIMGTALVTFPRGGGRFSTSQTEKWGNFTSRGHNREYLQLRAANECIHDKIIDCI